MKKALSGLCSIVILLTIAASCLTASASSTDSNKRAVFNYLTGEAGFNSAVACGIMANIEHESNFNPSAVYTDSNGLLSGGLCMWNGARFRSLKNFCNKNGYNYLGVYGQLKFLEHELKSDYFGHIYNYLKKVSNSSSGAYNAAYYWCYYFEVPSNKATRACERGRIAQNKYWPAYGGKTASAASVSVPALKLSCSAAGKTVDSGSRVSFSWTGGPSSCQNYWLCLKKPGQSSYTKISVNGSRKYTLSLKGLKTGKYTAYVIGKGANSKTVGKASATVSFTVQCANHDMVKTAVKKPTQTQNGYTVYTCRNCSAEKKVVSLSAAKKNLNKVPLDSLSACAASSGSITLQWSNVKNADGYFVFKAVGGKWTLVKTLSAKTLRCTVSGLKANTKYTFLVRAYAGNARDKNNRILSGYKTVSASTAPASPVLTEISRPGEGRVALKWNGSKGADGYAVYYSYSVDGEYKKLADVGKKTSFSAKGLKSGKKIYFRVKAYKKMNAYTAYSDFSKIKYAEIL